MYFNYIKYKNNRNNKYNPKNNLIYKSIKERTLFEQTKSCIYYNYLKIKTFIQYKNSKKNLYNF